MLLLQLIFHVYAYTITGEKIVGEYTEIGDGSSINFVLANSPSETKQTLVYVDGVETSATVGSKDGRTLITFSSPITASSYSYPVLQSETVRDVQ